MKKHGHAHRNVSVCSSDCLFGTQHCTALGHMGVSASLGLLLQLEYPRLEGIKLLPGMCGRNVSCTISPLSHVSAQQLSGGRI